MTPTRIRRLITLLTVALAAQLVALVPATAQDSLPSGPSSDVGVAIGFLDAGDTALILGTGLSMADMDLTSGALLDAGTGADGTVVLDMANDAMFAFDGQAAAAAARRAAEERRAQELAAARQRSGAGQSSVDVTECPTSAPAGTMRGRAASMSIAELCARSVAEAPTPEAARAVIWALNNLGIPYSQPNRNDPGWADCSSFVTRAYQRTGTPISPGWPPTTHSMTSRSHAWATPIPFADAQPGDLILEPAPGHVVMWLADGVMVHTNRNGDVSHVKNQYRSADLTLRVDPSKV